MSSYVFTFIVLLSVSQVFGKANPEDKLIDAIEETHDVVYRFIEQMSKYTGTEFTGDETNGADENIRPKRDEISQDHNENLEQIKGIIESVKDVLVNFIKSAASIRQSNLYKQAQQLGTDLQEKGKQLGTFIHSVITST